MFHTRLQSTIRCKAATTRMRPARPPRLRWVSDRPLELDGGNRDATVRTGDGPGAGTVPAGSWGGSGQSSAG